MFTLFRRLIPIGQNSIAQGARQFAKDSRILTEKEESTATFIRWHYERININKQYGQPEEVDAARAEALKYIALFPSESFEIRPDLQEIRDDLLEGNAKEQNFKK